MQYHTRIVSNRHALHEFLRLPWRIYCNEPTWVPPVASEVRRTLDAKRNPYFADAYLKLFICYDQNNNTSARVAIVIDRRYREKYGVKSAFFGFFECINDEDALRNLFDTALQYCRLEGVELLEGPFNPNHYSELGIQVNKFGTRPTFFQTYSHDYYPTLLERCGFSRGACLYTAKNDNICEYLRVKSGDSERRAADDDYTVRSLAIDNLEADLEKLREVFNDAFASNWHFLPVSREEYQYSAKFLRLVTDPKLIAIVEHNGMPVGVLMCVLDINPLLQKFQGSVGPIKYLRFLRQRRDIRTLIVYAVGVKKAYQRTHVIHILAEQLSLMARQYDALETTWISRDNAVTAKLAEKFGMFPDKYFAMYQMKVNSSPV